MSHLVVGEARIVVLVAMFIKYPRHWRQREYTTITI